jgi:large subunit ribosomal protein L32e
MTETTKLLEQRTRSKAKKPTFVRRESHYTARVKARWRKPRGKHSPVRRKKKGKQKLVTTGYGSPAAVRHLHSSGLKKVVVSALHDLEQIDPATEGAVISGTVGKRKRLDFLKFAEAKGITLLNISDPQGVIDRIMKELERRKDARTEKKQKKEKAKKESKKAKEEKEAKEKESKKVPLENIAEEREEKEKKERKEIEKTLIKRQ